MTNSMDFLNRAWNNSVLKSFVIALLITGVMFAYSNAVPEYIKTAVKADLNGLVIILYGLWLVLTIAWFRSWQLILHSSTEDK